MSIYILHNPIFNSYGKNVYKLGQTKCVKNRLNSYSTTYIDKCEMVFTHETSNCLKAERIIFYLLRRYRIRKHREFFNIELDIAKQTIKKVCRLDDSVLNDVYSKLMCGKHLADLSDEEWWNNVVETPLTDLDHFFETYRFKPKDPTPYLKYGYKRVEVYELNSFLPIEDEEI